MKAYLVTENDYSYSNTEAVFLDRALAEAYVEKFGKHLDIDEMEIGEQHHLDETIYDVYFNQDGQFYNIRMESPFGINPEVVGKWMGGHVYVKAKNEEEAKTFAEEIKNKMLVPPRSKKKKKGL